MNHEAGRNPVVDGARDSPRVALDRLTAIRSQTAEEVLAFLGAFSAALDVTPWTWPHTGRSILASEVFVDLDVLTQPWEPESARSMSERRHVEETDAARDEPATIVNQVERVRWSQLLRTPRRRILKGSPGSGKSFLSRHAAAECLRHARDDLQARTAGVADLPATVWVSANEIAAIDLKASVTEALAAAAVHSLEAAAPVRGRVQAWLEARLLDESACVIVDAIDEVGPEKYTAFRRRLREVTALPGQLIVICRTLQWEFLKHELLPSIAAEEVELAPLTPTQLRAMVRHLFVEEVNSGAAVLALLQQNLGLRHACTTPLRLLFLCLLARDRRLAPATTYAGLYTHLLRALVEGRWRTRRPRWSAKSLQVEETIGALIRIGWVLFSSAPATNRFSLAAWTTAASATPMIRTRRERLLEDLVTLGILVPAGFDQLGDRCWSFAHRTLLEYLAARNLADRPTKEWLAHAKRHLWFEPEWAEVLTFLASVIPDATPFLRTLDFQNDDIFASILEMRSRVVGVARAVARARAGRVALAVMGMILNRAAVVPTRRYEQCIRVLGWAHLGAFLKTIVRAHDDAVARRAAAQAMGILGSTDAVESLVHALRTDREAAVRKSAAEALGSISAAETADALMNALRTDSDDSVRFYAAWALDALEIQDREKLFIETLQTNRSSHARGYAAAALSQRGSLESVEALYHALTQDSASRVRARAASSLGQLRAMQAAEPLFLATVEDRGVEVRRAAARALRGLGRTDRVTEAVDVLTRVIQGDPNYENQELAAEALGYLGGNTPTALLQALRSSDRVTRHIAAGALGHHAGDESVDALLSALCEDGDKWVRGAAAFWLGWQKPLGRMDVAQRLCQALVEDNEGYVRAQAAFALGESRPAESASELIRSMIRDRDWLVRKEAAVALGRIGEQGAFSALLQVARDDEKEEVRRAAAEALASGSWRAALPIRDSPERPLGWAPYAAIGLNNFGLQLRDRHRFDEAREFIHAALMLNVKALGRRHPKVPHRLMNLAGVELLRGQHRRASTLLTRAWNHQAHAADMTAARILILRLAVALISSETRGLYIGQLKTILDNQVLSDVAHTESRWTVNAVLDYVVARVDPEGSALLRAVVKALDDRARSTLLNEIHEWRRESPVPLDRPWKTGQLGSGS